MSRTRLAHLFRAIVNHPPNLMGMVQPHPHSGATYKLIARKDGAFEVEVLIPDTSPTTVTNFPTEVDAQRWIAKHEAAVAAGRPERPSFRMPGKHS